MATKEITTVFFCQQASYLQPNPDIASGIDESELPAAPLLFPYGWSRVIPRGTTHDGVAILIGLPVQPIANA